MSVHEPIKERHVRPHPRGGWEVTGVDPKRPSSHHETVAQAHAWARALLLKVGGGTINVYGNDGRLRQREDI